MPGDRFSVGTRSELRRCKAILFDFGGTLDSDGEHWLDRFYALYESAGLEVPRDLIKKVFYQADQTCCDDPQVDRMGLRPLMEYHIRHQFALLNLHEASQQARQMALEFCAKTEYCLKRNAALLRRLRNDYRMGVVSNFYGNVAALCEEAGLTEHLITILDSTRLGYGKPNREIFERALQDLDVTAEDCIFVGDSYDRDMLPARRMGMKTIWIKGPNPRFPAEPEPVDWTIESLAELESLLL
ncbi:HAD family hydrolase [Desulfoferrobacter suflitae]|uniref:HAD family hydrolase n=1 Tax=Desulfoferrobacter suflitae TaxID=2865782 RepID=UPI00216426BB|nr:HAD family hydrolase [Desulfoferrobacter suflitae]MCK8604070.1 HAD family hydrolase [Desulfoferrobacter suflitae]